jgi:lipopolysaccharide export system protein LptA
MIFQLFSFVMFCAAAPATPPANTVEAPVAKAVDAGTISSSNASYDGNALVLKGQVVLDHGFGKMQAEEAILQKQEVGKDFPFSLIHLEKDVFLKLNQNGELKCEKADLDFGALKGFLTSSRRVSYTDTLKKKKGPSPSFQLTSSAIDLQFLKKTDESKVTYDVQDVLARDNVELSYADGFTLFTDAILYKKELLNPSSNEFQTHLSSQGKQKCKLVHQADTIEADSFHLDILHTRLSMVNPQGILPSFGKGEVRFSAESLLWNHEQNTLILKGNPTVQEPNLGTVVSDKEIYLFQKDKSLVGFKGLGNTTLTYLNNQQLVSHGTLSFDRERKLGTVESPIVNGIVSEENQLSYKEGEMLVLADKAHIEYTEENGTFHPVSVSLKGQVKVSSSGDKPSRYGLADRLTYNPTTKTFILGADPGKKVIFVNNEENIRISAQEVHITQDPTTKKQSVKGLGNVQLALSTEEQLSLNKYFGKYAPPTP